MDISFPETGISILALREDSGGLEKVAAVVYCAESDSAIYYILPAGHRIYPSITRS